MSQEYIRLYFGVAYMCGHANIFSSPPKCSENYVLKNQTLFREWSKFCDCSILQFEGGKNTAMTKFNTFNFTLLILSVFPIAAYKYDS